MISDETLAAELRALEDEQTAEKVRQVEQRIAARAAEAERQRAAEQAEADENMAKMQAFIDSVQADAVQRERNRAMVNAARAFWSAWHTTPDAFDAAMAWHRFAYLGIGQADSQHRAWLLGRLSGDIQTGQDPLPGEEV